ncbi:MAG: AMP-binding protein, partial [Firmicutes bacterium]|nr:AMP-binding protein [Bacillota bacterium]
MAAIENLRDMINASADKYGEQAAYLYKEKPGGPYLEISFEQFRNDVYCLGTALIDAGFSGCRMAVIGENRYEWIVTYLAVACGLGVIVPLDKELPPQEIAALIKRAELTGITYSSKVAGRLREALNILDSEGADISSIRLISMEKPPVDLEVLHLNTLIEKGRKLRAAGTRRYDKLPIDRDGMRILLFTSGTTGLAKGVMLSHKNLCSNVLATAVYVDLDRLNGPKVGLSILPMHHTYEFSANVLGSLYQGGTLAFCEGLKHIVKNMGEAGTTYMIAVPLIFENMHSKIWKKAEKEGKAEAMRALVRMIRNVSKIGLIDKKLAKRTAKMFKAVHEAFGGKLQLMIAGAAAIDPDVISDFNAMGFR